MPSINVSQSQQQGRSRQRSTSRTGIVPGMMGIYNQQLELSQQNYQNLLSGYSQAQTNTSQQLQQAYGGFDKLQSNVMNQLQGQGGYEREMNRRTFEQQQGKSQQQLVNSGLGNSTIQASMSNQNALNYALAGNELSERLGRQSADYMSKIGLARQDAMMKGTGMQSDMASHYLSDLAGYHFANTPVMGSFSQSSGSSNNTGSSSSLGQSVENPMGGGGGRGMGPIPGEPYPQRGGGQSLAGTGYGDVSAGGGLYQPGYSPSGYQPGAPTTNFMLTPTPESGGYAGSNFSSNFPDTYRGLS